MQSQAKTVSQYLKELPEDRRVIVSAVRETILQNLDSGFEEGMQYGMIGYYVPHRIYPAGYHCDPRQPVPYAAIASQKNAVSIYLMTVYAGPLTEWFREAWKKTGRKLDMGKSCVRVKKMEDIAFDVIAETIRRVPAETYISRYISLRDAGGDQDQASAKQKKTAASSRAAGSKSASKSAPKTLTGSKKSASPKESGAKQEKPGRKAAKK